MIALSSLTFVQHIVPLILAAVVVIFVVELIRRRKLREEYAMLWICASVVLLVFAAAPQLLWWIAKATRIDYQTLMLLMSFCFLSLVIVHLSVAVSRTSDDLRKLAQRTALLEQELCQLRKSDSCPSSDSSPAQAPDAAAQSPDESV